MARSGRRIAHLFRIAAASAAGLAACAPETGYNGPSFPFQSGYRGAVQSAVPVLLGNDAWWQRLRDPVLDRLVTQALADSLTLAQARERVVEARAQLRAVPGAAVVTSSLATGVTGNNRSDPEGSSTFDLGLSWILDPYGAKRAEIRAAGARVEVADAEADAARLLLLQNLATAYVDLRYRQRLLALRQQEYRGRQQTLALTRTMMEENAATRLETTRSEARVAEIRSQIPGLEAGVAAKKNEIAVLAGAAPGRLAPDLASALDRGAAQPRPQMPPSIGIPADLLRNRPDIRIAERRYYAALAEIDQARAALYPRLSLTGTISVNGLTRGGSGTEYFFGPVLQFPALPSGSARAGVESREARARQAHAAWHAAVLGAILEVENALIDYRAVNAAMASAGRAARLYREALEMTREVFRAENATLGDLIDAEQALASAEQAHAEAIQRQAQSFVLLNVRLGAGHAAGAR